MMTDNLQADEVASEIIRQNTCGLTDCFAVPTWQLALVHIWTTDGGEVQLSGFKDDPLNRVCDLHKNDVRVHKMIGNKAWLIILRQIEIENPGLIKEIGKKFRMRRIKLGWNEL
jgi:hypothetical protein